ncbi:MAG: hypothetical protein AB7I50_05735 [Vicinamibacterales bacterium]
MRFERALDQISSHCPDTLERLGDQLVAGHTALITRGKLAGFFDQWNLYQQQA